MPNWCDNEIIISGAPEEVHKCVQFVKGKDEEGENAFDFDRIIPCPKELYESPKTYTNDPDKEKKIEQKQAEMKEKYGYATAYDFHCGQWGTKWNSCGADVGYSEGDNVASYYFQTAWSPPVPVVDALSKKFPTLDIEIQYLEMGMCFGGTYSVYGGEVTNDQSVDDTECPLFIELAEKFGYGDWLEEMAQQEAEEEAEKEKEEAEEQAFQEALKKAEEEDKLAEMNSCLKVTPEAVNAYREKYMR